jgi:hypothetical protein
MEEVYKYQKGRMLPQDEMPDSQDYIALVVAFVVTVIAVYFLIA